MRAVFVSFAVLAGCSGGAGAGSPTEPQSGVWTYVSTSIDVDTCDIVPLLGLDGGEFMVTHDDAAGTLTIDDGEWVFDCTLTGADFDCPDRFPGGYESAGVQMELVGEASGTFSSGTEATGVQSGTASCADASCEMAAGMLGISPPCDVSVQFLITHDG